MGGKGRKRREGKNEGRREKGVKGRGGRKGRPTVSLELFFPFIYYFSSLGEKLFY